MGQRSLHNENKLPRLYRRAKGCVGSGVWSKVELGCANIFNKMHLKIVFWG
jgi:hypothetical protein